MRELVQPTLGWFLRLSLFLVVTAWAVSQWWSVATRFPPVTVLLLPEGWVVAAPGEMASTIDVRPAAESLQNRYFFQPRRLSKPNLSVRGLSVAGLTVNYYSGRAIRDHAIVGIRHQATIALSVGGLALFELVSCRRRRRSRPPASPKAGADN